MSGEWIATLVRYSALSRPNSHAILTGIIDAPARVVAWTSAPRWAHLYSADPALD